MGIGHLVSGMISELFLSLCWALCGGKILSSQLASHRLVLVCRLDVI